MDCRFREKFYNLTIKEEIFYTILFFSTATLIIFGSFLSYGLITANLGKALDSVKNTNIIINTSIEGERGFLGHGRQDYARLQ